MQLTSCLNKIYKALNFSENQYFKSCWLHWHMNFWLLLPFIFSQWHWDWSNPKTQFSASKLCLGDRSSNIVYLLQIGGCIFPQLTPRASLSGSSLTDQGCWPFGVPLSEYKKCGKGEVVLHGMKECAVFHTKSLLYGYCFKIFDLLRSYLLWLKCTQLAQRLGH